MYVESINFSLWCDFLERSFLNDEFEVLIQDEIINGVTSNPSIFNKAFLNSPIYKSQINELQLDDPKSIYETLAFNDIKLAAKKLLPLYENGDDGFVSIEIDPFLANDETKSIEEGRRIYSDINMPNVMIKVPATKSGYFVMKTLLSEGISVNATLIFSPNQAQNVLDAMQEGIEMFARKNPNKQIPKGVISVFVSRFDRKLDSILQNNNLPTAQVGIMNAIKIYNLISETKNDHIRTLFASTGVKGDDLDGGYYVSKLLYPNTINTAPLDTIHTFVASGNLEPCRMISNDEIDAFFEELNKASIDLDAVYEELLDEGLKAFEDAFSEILNTLKK